MKGAVFIALNDMIENNYGLELWETALEKTNPDSGGIYASGSSYNDAELVAMVQAIAEEINIDIPEVTRQFGRYLFGELNQKFAIFSKMHDNLFDFLRSIEGVIHKEVLKLYNDASLPKINCKEVSPSHMEMHYSSPRKLCALAEGLIEGAAEHFKTNISLGQSVCCHRGDDHCVIDIRII